MSRPVTISITKMLIIPFILMNESTIVKYAEALDA